MEVEENEDDNCNLRRFTSSVRLGCKFRLNIDEILGYATSFLGNEDSSWNCFEAYHKESQDVSDAQWRNFRGNLPILTFVFGIFTLVANMLRTYYCLRAKGMSIVWLVISLAYLSYLHGACILFILSIAAANFLLVKVRFVVVLDIFSLS
ncbi:unnamed protein product [Ilex paraguariensis]|uniref:Uncharacterized protein n=1 Tax=Ilex paraguariensis TaxID=185542 RepID=A0ABC8SGP3_9AQUA